LQQFNNKKKKSQLIMQHETKKSALWIIAFAGLEER